MIQVKEAAVSPVIGVLLMLVVTIVIAAVVSGFAGGLASDQHKTPQASITAKSAIVSIQDTDTTNTLPDYPSGFTANNGIIFSHNGGDGFDLKDIVIQLQPDDSMIKISASDSMPTSNCTTSAVTSYIMKVGSSDTYIKGGDRFEVFADNCYDASSYAYGAFPPGISWKPANAVQGTALFTGRKSQYKIIDRASQKVISEGSIELTL